MNVFQTFRDLVVETLGALAAAGSLPAGLDLARVAVEPPRDPAHGDVSTNAALVLAKNAGQKPRAIAELLAARLGAHPDVAEAAVAGPGFVNLRLRDPFWQAQVPAIVAAGTGYGASTIGRGIAVNIEYVSANPTGPMHVGHGRGAVVGDALAALLAKTGFRVTREYYINDAGAQVDVLARSAHLRYLEALGEEIGAIPDGLYPGDYLKDVGRALARRDGDRWRGRPEAEWLAPVRDAAIAAMMALIREDLAALGIHHDVFTSERALHAAGAIDEAVALLESRGHIYVGVLEPPKGRVPDDWEPRPQTLFRATAFGDDVDRPLRKSDASWTYFAADIAYHRDKFRRGCPVMIDVWGADHKGYVKRMEAAVAAVTERAATLDVRICNLVHLLDKGEPVKMSKRAGTFVTLREVVDEVGKGVVRFMMLTRSNEAALDFDLAKVVEQSKDNPVFYVQYAHARAASVRRNAAEAFAGAALDDSTLASADVTHLTVAEELALVRLLAAWPRVVETAATAHEPHRVAYYLAEVAAGFHGLWNKGNETESLRFIVASDRALSLARLALVRATQIVIASGLAVMGVDPVEELR
ncbi:MAG: arginine--tRNA ligase [Alphaproteobacteria bacterium]|nr:arginine--tRNA ligase [Alphaproteobacteria bacterium]